MDRDTVDEYLQTGIYGPKEIKPEERKRFLGTLRERIVVALTHGEVRDNSAHLELEKIMKEHSKARLYLNGQIEYSTLSKYIKMAGKIGMPFTIVNNQEVETDIGLVVAYDYAIDKEDIFLKKGTKHQVIQQNDSGLLKKLKKLF
ncbi:YueI family protein [Bacillus sp. CGMCC 1.16607]|uniref:YueI family protein n=1 Tax=Bacillus sp. CGMCC 1.16607 TaxID=3351842 RepID=UPI00362ED7FE